MYCLLFFHVFYFLKNQSKQHRMTTKLEIEELFPFDRRRNIKFMKKLFQLVSYFNYNQLREVHFKKNWRIYQ